MEIGYIPTVEVILMGQLRMSASRKRGGTNSRSCLHVNMMHRRRKWGEGLCGEFQRISRGTEVPLEC